MERWLVILIGFHAFLLMVTQWMLLHTDAALYVQPLYEYLGVQKNVNGNIIETIDRFIPDVLSF
ncbi:DUF5359 family protein [Pontibacillus salicampi]|uniref:DUF5359 family protein n=1 Tax=Pontibacillus salicampi TaxID=1449801 RepID=A0ABV6LL46_9BACI